MKKGFTLIELMIVIAIIAVIAAIAIPSLLSSRKAANETSAIGTLKALFTAETQFRIMRKNGRNYGTFQQLFDNDLFVQWPDGRPANANSAPKSGYTFNLSLTLSGGTSTYSDYMIFADADTANEGGRDFLLSSDGLIHYTAFSATGNATLSDPTID